MSLLTRHGYIISFEDFSQSHENELTVTQEVSPYFNTDAQTFKVFVNRDDGTIAIPRFWGIQNFGRPVNFMEPSKIAHRLTFRGELRSDLQMTAVDASMNQLRSHGGGVLSLATGEGKCHGKDTIILMFDGSTKAVQDIEKGDLLMGDDSTPRRVLSLTKGTDEMYDVVPNLECGDKYTVNKEHILVLKNTAEYPIISARQDLRYDVKWWENCKQTSKVHDTMESAKQFLEKIKHKHQNIVEIPVKDYIMLSEEFKHYYKGYRVAIEFDEKPLPIDPYMIGVLLGDVISEKPQITSQDDVILEYFTENLDKCGLYLTKQPDTYTYEICSLYRSEFKNLNLINNKHIPMVYKCNSRKNRLRLLAGILDTVNHTACGLGICLSHEYIIQKYPSKLIDDIVFLCRSLGFSCYKSKQSKGRYYRICIYGNGVENIPTLLSSKQATFRRQRPSDNLVTGITVKHVGTGEYYGFTLDGNNRYVLGDFTVTHNTVISLYTACNIKLKTLVVVHKQFLLDQWEERIRTFVPLARIGRIQQSIEDVDECDIVVGMLQSIAMREYNEDIFRDFGMVIFDEVHVVPAPVFSRALLRLSVPYMLGLSATPVRKDGLTHVINWFVGPTFFKRGIQNKSNVRVFTVHFQPNRVLPINMVAATSILCNMESRNLVIVEKIIKLAEKGHKIILLSDRRAHCQNLLNMLHTGSTIGGALYLGGMKNFELKESEKCTVLFGTYGLAKEGLDIPSLDALVLATPRSDVIQACGRILHGKTALEPVIVDIVDQWFLGRAQHNKRLQYYKQAGFTI